MTKPYFALLRSYMTKEGIDQKYLAEIMGKSQTYITNRFTLRYPWTQDDQYFLMDELGIPYEDMYLVFPKNGRRVEDVCKTAKLQNVRSA